MVMIALMAAALGDFRGDPQLSKYQDLPRDVRVYIGRRIACGHWSGEVSGDRSERDRQVEREFKKLGCEHIDRDELRMKGRYRSDGRVLNSVAETRDLVW